MYITQVEIQNIRSIGKLQLRFEQAAGWHVLIGDNGAGKSTILRAIALGLIGPEEALALRIDFKDWIKKSEQNSYVRLRIKKSGKLDSYKGSRPPITQPYWANIIIANETNGYKTAKVKAGKIEEEINPEKYLWSDAKGWFSASFGPFRRFTGGDKEWNKVYYSNPKAAAHLSVFGEDVALTESIEWLVKLNYKKLEKDQEATWLLDKLINFINKGGLLPHGARIKEIRSSGVFLTDGNGHEIELTEMSDGYRSVLSMIFELIRQLVFVYGAKQVFDNMSGLTIDLPGVVLIDEVDAHLHPTWQTRIGQWFTRYFPKMQFIVTSHSPLVCRAAEKGTIWRLAAPSGNFESYELKGADRDRLIYGNVLDAFGTEAFGQGIDRSAAGQEKLEKLAELETLHTFGKLNAKDKEEMKKLQQTFPTDDRLDL
jgi:predicted ATPase